MARNPKTIRLPEQLEQEIEAELARRSVREWSSGVVDLLTEAVRMRRVPGIVFVDSRIGRSPVVAGTGVDVWEVVSTWKALGQEEETLRERYHWLGQDQLRAALSYYALYPGEVDARLSAEERWTPERVFGEMPFARLGRILPEARE